MWTNCVLILLFCVNYSFGHRLKGDARETLVWPTEYHIRAEKMDFKSGVFEPIEFWSSPEFNLSRFDYYGGMVKKFYYWETDETKPYVLSVFPTSTEDEKNKLRCAALKEDAKLHDLLPKVDGFTYTGEAEHEGYLVQVWEDKRIYKEYLWKESTLYTNKYDDVIVPVQLVTKVYYNSRSSLFGHSVMNFYDFETSVTEDDMTPKKHGCKNKVTLGKDFHEDLQHLHPFKDTDVDFAFESYKKHHKKNYEDEEEHEMRRLIFQRNWEMITNHNRKNLGYQLELNQFADITPDEVDIFTGLLTDTDIGRAKAFPHSDKEVKAMAEELPENYDMRVEGFITPVKNQARCGSCWAFSSTAAIEGALARLLGRILDLSEQSLVDCSWGFYNLGCNGGTMPGAYQYIIEHGIPLEEEYGNYLEQDGYCHADNMTKTFSITGFGLVTPRNPQALKVALYHYGPVSVAINFSDKMRFYASGVFYDPECNSGHINHGVTLVGYGVKDGTDYWIAKNSHSEGWGEDGYLLLSAKDNNCFVLDRPSYPLV